MCKIHRSINTICLIVYLKHGNNVVLPAVVLLYIILIMINEALGIKLLLHVKSCLVCNVGARKLAIHKKKYIIT